MDEKVQIKDLKLFEFGDSECYTQFTVLAKDMITAIKIFYKFKGYYAEIVKQREIHGAILIQDYYEPEVDF
jgi:hypothetical protein